MSDDPRDPSTEHVFSAFKLTLLNSISGSTPGIVTKYDGGKQRVSVQPMIMHGVDDESENRITETPPQRHDVPVVFIGTAAGRMTFPIAAGDQCLLISCGLSIAAWKDKGGVIDPVDDRRHDINDCVALFGLYDYAHLPTDAPTDATVLWGGDVRIGAYAGAEKMVKGETYRSAEDTLLTALATFVAAQATYNAAVGTALGLIAPAAAVAAAAAAMESALTSFTGAAATYLATNGKVV